MKRSLISAALFGILFFLLVFVIQTVDVAPIGPAGTSVGLSAFNQSIHQMTGVNFLWYDLTDYLGLAAILTAGVFALAGLWQMIRRRSLLKVDEAILAAGCLYAATIALYLLFELVIVNYRPVLMPGCDTPEASFPSSHTMLVCCVMGSALMLIPRYIRNKALRFTLCALCMIILALTVCGRLLSGVHWATDILGGLLISGFLLSAFSAALAWTER